MSRGYIAIAQNSKVDYLKLAYVPALSLKATQKKINLCLRRRGYKVCNARQI